jgi:hypothetical protein
VNALPYRSRPRRFLGIEQRAGYRLKCYAISHDGQWPGADWQPALARLCARLPRPACGPGRPGVGLLILHRGRGADYAVLGWWQRDNELPLRLQVRENGAGWRAARDGESVCVWDLELIAFERDAYVSTLLSEAGDPDAIGYLARRAVDLG